LGNRIYASGYDSNDLITEADDIIFNVFRGNSFIFYD